MQKAVKKEKSNEIVQQEKRLLGNYGTVHSEGFGEKQLINYHLLAEQGQA